MLAVDDELEEFEALDRNLRAESAESSNGSRPINNDGEAAAFLSVVQAQSPPTSSVPAPPPTPPEEEPRSNHIPSQRLEAFGEDQDDDDDYNVDEEEEEEVKSK